MHCAVQYLPPISVEVVQRHSSETDLLHSVFLVELTEEGEGGEERAVRE